MFEGLKVVSSRTSSSRTRGTTSIRTTGSSCELTWNTFRDHLILEYEIPKYDGDLGSPNVFVPLDELARRREGAVCSTSSLPSQHGKHWFDEELFLGLMRLRGHGGGHRAATPRRSPAASCSLRLG